MDPVLAWQSLCRTGREYAKGRQQSVVSSGRADFDRWLPMGGWQKHAAIECVVPHFGIGEMALPMAYFRTLPAKDAIFCVGMPYLPCAPAWAQQAGGCERFWFVRAENDADALWALLQALASGLFRASMVWLAQPLRQSHWQRIRPYLNSSLELLWIFRVGRPTRFSPVDYRFYLRVDGRAHLLVQPYRLPGQGHKQAFCWQED